jgi:hypothetical protein
MISGCGEQTQLQYTDYLSNRTEQQQVGTGRGHIHGAGSTMLTAKHFSKLGRPSFLLQMRAMASDSLGGFNSSNDQVQEGELFIPKVRPKYQL